MAAAYAASERPEVSDVGGASRGPALAGGGVGGGGAVGSCATATRPKPSTARNMEHASIQRGGIMLGIMRSL
jgi:hypothetical protein